MNTNILTNEKLSLRIIGILSVVVPVLVAILLFSPSKLTLSGGWVKFLPHLNGMMNTAASIALIFGFYFIKKGNILYHRVSMIAAFVMGSIFLVSYVIYHSIAPSTHFGGEGIIRPIYFGLLISHIILAAIVVPFVLLAMYYGLANKIIMHKKIVKWTFPIWLYVSITGVVVYLMISPYYI